MARSEPDIEPVTIAVASTQKGTSTVASGSAMAAP
jgi:hypothetical protein